MPKFIKTPLFIIIFTIFLDALGFGILIPIVPLLLADPSSSFYILSKGVDIKTGYILLGLLTATFPLLQLFSTSILGELSDKLGRKPILQNTIFLTSASYVLFAIGIAMKNIPLLFISRAMAGFSSGNISVAQAAIADITEPKNRAKNFGLIGAAFGLGFIIGPFLGGKLSDPTVLPFFNPTIPFFFAALLSFINAISARTFLQETNKFINKEKAIAWGKSLVNIVKAFQLPNLRFLYLVNFLFFSGFTFFVTFFSIFLIKKFQFSQGDIGNFFSFFGLWFLVTQGLITGIVAKKFSEAQVLKVCLIADGIVIGLMFMAPSPMFLYILAPFFALFNGLAFSNTGALISRSADQKIQGEILGINASVQALAQLIPPIISGFIAAAFAPETPLIIAAVIVITSGITFLLFYKPPKEAAHIEDY
jgi:DHA1 family tetracycline resistance protein-like MFS transporter